MRTGLGFDLHRVHEGKEGLLVLAGVRVPAPYQLRAHSDGDLVLHALSDAIFSAVGAGDIGEKFPPGSAKTKGMDSKKILRRALREAQKKSAWISNVSIVLAAEKPKLAPYRKKITAALAALLGLNPSRVGITFKTFEGLPGLASQAVACWAHCLLEENGA